MFVQETVHRLLGDIEEKKKLRSGNFVWGKRERMNYEEKSMSSFAPDNPMKTHFQQMGDITFLPLTSRSHGQVGNNSEGPFIIRRAYFVMIIDPFHSLVYAFCNT